MAKGFFVTGTDTGVGKTVVSGVLIKAVGMCGLSVCGMKPIESGCTRRGGALLPSDGMFLKDISHMGEPVKYVTPCCLEHPLAPLAAAEREGKHIDLDNVLGKFRLLSESYDAVIVEGIGGIRVPIRPDYSVADLAGAMGLPLVVVASPFLGTINHTLLTLDHALSRGLEVAGIVINYMRPAEGTIAEDTNASVLEKLSTAPIIGRVPYLGDTGGKTLEKAAVKHLDLRTIKNHIMPEGAKSGNPV
jgi:dethiobiotin synthetase